jgi:hypothetical protein
MAYVKGLLAQPSSLWPLGFRVQQASVGPSRFPLWALCVCFLD